MNVKLFGYSIQLGKDKPVQQAAKPARATGVIRKQAKREVSFQIADIKTAVQMAQNAEQPNRSKLHEIYRYILRDGHTKSQIRTAKYKVLSEPWLLYRDGKPDLAASELFRKRWLNLIIEYIIEAELHGYSVIELDGLNAATATIMDVKLIDREFISIEKQWILPGR